MSGAGNLDKRMQQLGKRLLSDIRDGVNVAARAVQGAAMGNLAEATGGNFQLSGVRKKDAESGVRKSVERKTRLGVQMQPSTSLKNSTAVVRGFPPGLFTIVERGTKTHAVGVGKVSKNGFASSLAGRYTGAVTAKGNIGRRVDGPIVIGTNKVWSGRKRVRQDRGRNPNYKKADWVTGPRTVSGSKGKRPLGRARDRYRADIPRIVNAKTEDAIVGAGFRQG